MAKGMRGISGKTAAETDAELAAEEAKLLSRTATNLATLRPRVSDKQAFDKLIEAVRESTSQNESVAELQNRLKALGETVLKVAKEVYGLLPK